MSENELATIAVDLCYRIHKGLGPGLLESVYEEAFAYELTRSGIDYTRQEPIKVWYDGVLLNVGFRADFILEEKLLIELKSIERIEKIHHKVILNYLRILDLKLGLLINFNEILIKNGIYRKFNGELA